MKNTTNVWQRGTACALGGFIGIFISRQFSNDLLWTSVGLIIGLFAGWMVAMFADNPRGFVEAIKDAFAEARNRNTEIDYPRFKLRATFIFWLSMGAFAITSTILGLMTIIAPVSLIGLIVQFYATFILTTIVPYIFIDVEEIPITEKSICGIKKLAYRGNLIGLTYCIISGICRCIAWAWARRTNIRRAIGVFFASMFLYFHENAGLAIITNVALALGVGHYYGYVAGVTVGFISGVTGAVIYNKGQDSLRAIVAKSS